MDTDGTGRDDRRQPASGASGALEGVVDAWLPERFARRGTADALLRVGLGVVVLLAGLHKLVAPADWGVYLAPLFARRWPIPVDLTMVLFGLSELPVGLLLILDRFTALAAGIVAVSMAGVVVDLAVAALQTGRFVDVLVRDIGLAVLATGVTLRAAGEE